MEQRGQRTEKAVIIFPRPGGGGGSERYLSLSAKGEGRGHMFGNCPTPPPFLDSRMPSMCYYNFIIHFLFDKIHFRNAFMVVILKIKISMHS